MNGTEGSLTEILGQRVIGLSQLSGTMGELTVLVQRADAIIGEMSAQLSLVLLLQSVELALVAIEVVVIALLSQVAQDLAGRIVEVLLATVVVLGGFFTRRVGLLICLARESGNLRSGSTLSELLLLALVLINLGFVLFRSLRVRGASLVSCGSSICRVSYLRCS